MSEKKLQKKKLIKKKIQSKNVREKSRFTTTKMFSPQVPYEHDT